MAILNTPRRASLIAVALMILNIHSYASAAAGKSVPVPLSCKTVRLTDNGEVQFSLVMDESKKSVLINGIAVQEVKFDEFKVNGKSRAENPSIPGVSYEVSFSLDRITGKFALLNLPVPTRGSEFTEEQKALINARPIDPSFMGTCAPAKALF